MMNTYDYNTAEILIIRETLAEIADRLALLRLKLTDCR